MGWRGYVLWGGMAYLGCLMASLPVGWVFMHAAPYLPLPIRLIQPHGTPWEGGVEQVVVGPLAVGPLRWQWQWHAPWQGHIGVAVQWGQLPDASGQATLRAWGNVSDGLHTLSLEEGTLTLSLPWVAAQHPLLPPGTAGTVHATLDRLVWDVRHHRINVLQGSANLSHLYIGAPINLRLGHYRVRAQSGEQEAIRITLESQEASLRANVTLRLRHNGHYRLRGTLTPYPAANERTRSFLEWMGTPLGQDGRVRLDMTGMM